MLSILLAFSKFFSNSDKFNSLASKAQIALFDGQAKKDRSTFLFFWIFSELTLRSFCKTD